MAGSVTCPKCSRMVSLPGGGQAAAWVRCPLCKSEYRLQEAIDFVPPALEIILPPERILATFVSSAPRQSCASCCECSR